MPYLQEAEFLLAIVCCVGLLTFQDDKQNMEDTDKIVPLLSYLSATP
jgi:hypothetical protein